MRQNSVPIDSSERIISPLSMRSKIFGPGYIRRNLFSKTESRALDASKSSAEWSKMKMIFSAVGRFSDLISQVFVVNAKSWTWAFKHRFSCRSWVDVNFSRNWFIAERKPVMVINSLPPRRPPLNGVFSAIRVKMGMPLLDATRKP